MNQAWFVQNLDSAKFGSCTTWILQNFNLAKFGIVRNLDSAVFGSFLIPLSYHYLIGFFQSKMIGWASADTGQEVGYLLTWHPAHVDGLHATCSFAWWLRSWAPYLPSYSHWSVWKKKKPSILPFINNGSNTYMFYQDVKLCKSLERITVMAKILPKFTDANLSKFCMIQIIHDPNFSR